MIAFTLDQYVKATLFLSIHCTIIHLAQYIYYILRILQSSLEINLII